MTVFAHFPLVTYLQNYRHDPLIKCSFIHYSVIGLAYDERWLASACSRRSSSPRQPCCLPGCTDPESYRQLMSVSWLCVFNIWPRNSKTYSPNNFSHVHARRPHHTENLPSACRVDFISYVAIAKFKSPGVGREARIRVGSDETKNVYAGDIWRFKLSSP